MHTTTATSVRMHSMSMYKHAWNCSNLLHMRANYNAYVCCCSYVNTYTQMHLHMHMYVYIHVSNCMYLIRGERESTLVWVDSRQTFTHATLLALTWPIENREYMRAFVALTAYLKLWQTSHLIQPCIVLCELGLCLLFACLCLYL